MACRCADTVKTNNELTNQFTRERVLSIVVDLYKSNVLMARETADIVKVAGELSDFVINGNNSPVSKS